MRLRDNVIGKIVILLSLPKIFCLRLFGVRVSFFAGVRIFGFPKINRGSLMTIGKGSTIGRLTRFQGKITIGENAFVNEFCSLNAGLDDEIIIGEYTSLAPDCYLITGDHDIDKNVLINVRGDEGGKRGSIVIGKNCWIGAKSIILKNVSIGDGAVIGAGSVVTRDIPPFAVAVGNPARVIKYRK